MSILDCTEGALGGVAFGGFELSVAGATTLGNTAEVVCQEGYELSEGTCVIVCLPDGTWSDTTAVCTPKRE